MIRSNDNRFYSLKDMGTLFALLLVTYLIPTTAHSQAYPSKSIRIIAGFSAGSATDATARLVGQKLSESLGQPVVVDNRVGAGGAIATERVATSPADGYTLLLLLSTDTILPALRKLPYDVERDLSPVSLVASGPQVLVVNSTVAVRDAKELIAMMRSQPGKLRYGSAGVGSASHMAGELLIMMAKVSIVQVPYKGASEMAVGTAANEVEMSFPSTPAAIPLMEAGKVKALAVTSAKRVSAMPTVPTLDEVGLSGYDRSLWYGIVAPAGTPKEIVARLHGIIAKALATDEFVKALNKQGLEPQAGAPEQFAARIHADLTQNAQLIKAAGIKVE